MPGVEGGVKAGDTKPGNSESWPESDSDFSSAGSRTRCAREGYAVERELRSSSEIARETGIGRGE